MGICYRCPGRRFIKPDPLSPFVCHLRLTATSENEVLQDRYSGQLPSLGCHSRLAATVENEE
jgi:hypothetical protein